MTLNFPSSPTNGQTYSLANGATYTWDGEKWKASNIPDSSDVVQTSDNPSDGEVLTYNSSLGTPVWSSAGGGGIASVSADTSPQLGGDLDVNNMYIKNSITNGNVVLTPNGWGTVNINSAGGSGATYPRVRLRNSSARYIEIKTNAGTSLSSWTCTLPNNNGNANQVLKTDGNGQLSWVDPGVSASYVNTNFAMLSGSLFTGPIMQNGSAVSSTTIDLSLSNYFTKTINGATTFTFNNAVPSPIANIFTLRLEHTSGTVTWPGSVTWPSSTAPVLTTGKTHLFIFVSDDGGTTWRGSSLINY